MKNLTRSFTILVFCVFSISCTNSEIKIIKKINEEKTVLSSPIDKCSWLIGSWGNSENGVSTTENWRKQNEKTFVGESFSILKKDTVSFESISIQEIDSKLYYIPIVKGQNENQAVKFELQSSSDKQLVFVNI